MNNNYIIAKLLFNRVMYTRLFNFFKSLDLVYSLIFITNINSLVHLFLSTFGQFWAHILYIQDATLEVKNPSSCWLLPAYYLVV